MAKDFLTFLEKLNDEGVEFVIVGGKNISYCGIAVQNSCSGYMYFQEKPMISTGWSFYPPGFTMRFLVRDQAQESNLPCPLFSKEGNR
jgi:hypothetical protein